MAYQQKVAWYIPLWKEHLYNEFLWISIWSVGHILTTDHGEKQIVEKREQLLGSFFETGESMEGEIGCEYKQHGGNLQAVFAGQKSERAFSIL